MSKIVSSAASGFYCIDNGLLRTYGPKLGPFGIAVLNVIVMHANEAGECWPSHQTIADMAGMSRRQVMREVEKLIDLGLIECEARAKKGMRQSHMYRVLRCDTQSQRCDRESQGSDTQSPPDVTHSPERCDGESHKQEPIEQEPIEQEPMKKVVGAGAPTPPDPEAEETDWDRWLKALCWICHAHMDTTKLTIKDFDILTAEAKRIKKLGYAQPSLVKGWFTEHWKHDWRWKNGSQRPSAYQVRQLLPGYAETVTEMEGLMETGIQHRSSASYSVSNGAKKPRPAGTRPPPAPDDPWAIVVAELETEQPRMEGILQRAKAEMIGEKDEAQVWEISLAMQDAREFTYMQGGGAVLIRKTLTSILGRAVLVDVIVPETVPA